MFNLPKDYVVDSSAPRSVEGMLATLAFSDDDHAGEANGVGFSKADQRGHEYAEMDYFGVPFSYDQAVDALGLITKYRRQLFGGDTEQYQQFKATPVFKRQPAEKPSTFRTRGRMVWVEDGKLRMKHPFGDEMWNAIRTTFRGAQYDKESNPKAWVITVNGINTPTTILEFLKANQFIVLEETENFLKNIKVEKVEEKSAPKASRVINTRDDKSVVVKFDYNAELVTAVKSALNVEYNGKKFYPKFDGANRQWIAQINPATAIGLNTLIKEHGFDADDRIKIYVSRCIAKNKRGETAQVVKGNIEIDTSDMPKQLTQALMEI